MAPFIIPLIEFGTKLIEKFIPDPEAKAKAQLDLMQQAQAGEFKELEARMSAIIAEAQSPDPWTSRARPSFLWVIYILILASIPMGVLAAFFPELAANIIAGFKAWLAAIPEDMWWLFGSGYLGYTAARQYGKAKGTDR